MKTSHLLSALAALIVIAAGCAMHTNEETTDPHTKYVVRFDTPTELVSKPAFIQALNKASWYRDIKFTDQPAPLPDFTGVVTLSPVVHTLLISQDSVINPNSARVTQRIGFNALQEHEMAALLKQVKE